ncbi:hypothetical protein, partial [Pseudomonas protegens]
MSIYQRIYIKTHYPREVGQLIVNMLGGDGRLEQNDNREYLRPIHVTMLDQHSVLPTRSFCGSPLESKAKTG